MNWKEVKDRPLTPEEFTDKMKEIVEKESYNTEFVHICMDGAMCSLLESLGYGKAIKIFDNTSKSYS